MAFLVRFALCLTSDLEVMTYAAPGSWRDDQTCQGDLDAACTAQVHRGHGVEAAEEEI